MAEKKLLAALPDTLRSLLTQAEKLVGFEKPPGDIFHPEPAQQEPSATALSREQADLHQSYTISVFFQAVLDSNLVLMQYASPYRTNTSEVLAEPFGLLWDRDRWYLAGRSAEQEGPVRLWRADRVVQIKLRQPLVTVQSDYFFFLCFVPSFAESAKSTAWKAMTPCFLI